MRLVTAGTRDTDREQVAAALGGDDAAWAAIYDALAPSVLRFLRGLGLVRPAELEDAVQETFARLVQDLPRWDPSRSALRTFALGVARHVAIDGARRREVREAGATRLAAAASRAGAAPGARPSERLTRADDDAQVQAALLAVEPELRGLLVLRHAGGLSLAELAEVGACSVPTLRERLRKAARRFAVELRRRGVLPGTEEGP